MSGFGGFNKIGGNNPANIIYTGNVENIQQPNVDPQPVNVVGVEPQDEPPGNVGARGRAGRVAVLGDRTGGFIRAAPFCLGRV